MTLRLLCVLSTLIISVNCAVGAEERPDSAFETFKKTLATTAGTAARACGEVTYQGDSKEAFKCARDAIAVDIAFWVLAQKRAGDSSQWVGAARDEHGVLYQVHFDPSTTEKSGAKTKAKFTIDRCSSLRFDEDKNRILCVPSTRR